MDNTTVVNEKVEHGRQLALKVLSLKGIQNKKIGVVCDATVADSLATGFIDVLKSSGISAQLLCLWYTELGNTGTPVITKAYSEPNDVDTNSIYVLLRDIPEPLLVTVSTMGRIFSTYSNNAVVVASPAMLDTFKSDLLAHFPTSFHSRVNFVDMGITASIQDSTIAFYMANKCSGVPNIVKSRRKTMACGVK